MSPQDTPLALVVDDEEVRARHRDGHDVWSGYAAEVLDHLRLPSTVLAPADVPQRLDGIGVLVFPAAPSLPGDVADRVAAWIEGGGVALICGGAGSLGPALGLRDGEARAEGHVHVEPVAALPSAPDVDLHGFGGVAVTAPDSAEVWARWSGDGAPAAVSVRSGQGLAVVFGVDPWQSIVRIQQGWPVHTDGVPPADGSAPVDEGILKTDDGLALSYDRDRALPPGQSPQDAYSPGRPALVAAPIFHRPHADLWRWLVLHGLLAAADHRGVVLAWLHYWPAGVPALGHLSHDSDQNKDVDAKTAIDAFGAAGAPATWCHCFPGGYSPEWVEAIAAAGHEQALHYNALGDVERARWGREYLAEQHAWASEMVGRHIVSNKNHYLRWEGWTEFYAWCEELGIELDESYGPSKPGNIGFPFGSSHVSFPLGPASEGNRRYDVLSLPLHTQDLYVFGHESVRDVIVEQALEHHGVAHFLFHGANLTPNPEAVDACVAVVRAGRDRGMDWWTGERINAWERARRSVSVSAEPSGNGWRVSVTSGARVDGAGIVLPLPGVDEAGSYDVKVESAPGGGAGSASAPVVRRHGRSVVEIAVDLAEGETVLSVS